MTTYADVAELTKVFRNLETEFPGTKTAVSTLNSRNKTRYRVYMLTGVLAESVTNSRPTAEEKYEAIESVIDRVHFVLGK